MEELPSKVQSDSGVNITHGVCLLHGNTCWHPLEEPSDRRRLLGTHFTTLYVGRTPDGDIADLGA